MPAPDVDYDAEHEGPVLAYVIAVLLAAGLVVGSGVGVFFLLRWALA